MSKQDYLDLMAQRVQDTDSQLSTDDFDRALRAAVVKYSKDSPIAEVTDVVSEGGHQLPLPADFDPDFSEVLKVEYPVGKFPPCYLTNEQWGVLQSPSGYSIGVANSITTGDTVRVLWTRLHVVNDDQDTIHISALDAVSDWAASLLCHDLATLYSGDSDSSMVADSVDHNGKSQAFAARSRQLATRYYNALGIDPKRVQSAGAVVNLDTVGFGGYGRLLRRRVR